MSPLAYAVGVVALVGLARVGKALLDAGERASVEFAEVTHEPQEGEAS